MGKGKFSLLKTHNCVIFFIKRWKINIARLYFDILFMSFFTILNYLNWCCAKRGDYGAKVVLFIKLLNEKDSKYISRAAVWTHVVFYFCCKSWSDANFLQVYTASRKKGELKLLQTDRKYSIITVSQQGAIKTFGFGKLLTFFSGLTIRCCFPLSL